MAICDLENQQSKEKNWENISKILTCNFIVVTIHRRKTFGSLNSFKVFFSEF